MNLEMADIFNQAIAHYLSTFYTSLPAEVVNYTASKKMVTIKPLIKVKFQDGEEMSMPEISSVPVLFPGTKETVIQWNLKKGDTGLALFSTRSLELWLKGDGKEVGAGSPRKFSLTDAFFWPGLYTFSNPGKVGTGSGLEIIHNNSKITFKDNGDIDISGANINIDGSSNVNIDGANINLNGSTKYFVTYTELDTALQTFVSALNSTFASKLNGTGTSGALVLNIAAAKTNTVKTAG